MNKFKIGDKVRLRDDLKVGEEYGEVSFSSSMNKLKGKELTIEGMSLKGNYEIEESYFFLSDEMLEKVDDDVVNDDKKVDDVNTDNLLEFALDKFGISKEELEEEYKKNKIKEQELEDMKKRCNDFESYCSSNKCCIDCYVRKFQKSNGLDRLGTRNCMSIYEYLFKE